MWKKTNSKLGTLSKIRHFISEKTVFRTYKTMIQPHLDYIDFVVDSGSSDRVQKIDGLKKKVTDILMVKYKIEELRLRQKRNLVKIMYTQSKNNENLKATSVERTLRSANKIKMKSDFANITKVYNSPLYRGIRLWDSPPASLQKEEDKYSFKNNKIRMHASWGVLRPQAKGLEGIISSPIMHWRAFFILFHHFYTEKQVYVCYFLRITAPRPVGHVFVWLAHL